MALGISSTLYLCVAVSIPLILSKYGENLQPHIFSKVIDRQYDSFKQGLASLVLSWSTPCSANLTWCSGRHSVEAEA